MSAIPKPGSWIHSMKPITSSSATGSFIPDSPSSERASRFSSVERRSTAKIAAESVAAIAGADDHPFEGAEVEDPASPRGRSTTAVIDGADGRQRGRGAEHRPDLRPAGGQAALEEDQDEGDRAQGAGQLGVVEVDPADPLRAGEHPEPEEEQQAGDPDPVGEQRPDDAGGEQGAGDEDQLGVVLHPSTDPSRAALRSFSSSVASARLELLGRARPAARPRRARAGGGR